MENTREREIDLTYVKLCNERVELYKRNRRAERYSANAQRRIQKRNIKFAKFSEQVGLIILICAIITILAYGFIKEPSEPRYAIASAKQINGNHFIYITEKICKVEEIDGDYITVSYKGNEYDFFGDGYEIGEEIICQFTDTMEIVGVVD